MSLGIEEMKGKKDGVSFDFRKKMREFKREEFDK
jgi:hypothetical protein